MEYIRKILTWMYQDMEEKNMFLPLVVSNAIVCYKLVHYDRWYWMEFAKSAEEASIKIESIEDVFTFFDGFLETTPQFEFSHRWRRKRLREFENFFHDFCIKQKYFYKNPNELEKQMNIFVEKKPNNNLHIFVSEIFTIASEIRFKK